MGRFLRNPVLVGLLSVNLSQWQSTSSDSGCGGFQGGIGWFGFPVIIWPLMMIRVERRRSNSESVQILHYYVSVTGIELFTSGVVGTSWPHCMVDLNQGAGGTHLVD